MNGRKPGDSFPLFQLTEKEMKQLENDGIQRVFINTLVKVEDNKNYMG